MNYLRRVVIQDAAYFITQCPERATHAIFQDDMFKSTAFLKCQAHFAQEHTRRMLPQNDPTLKNLELVAPVIGNSLKLAVQHSQGNMNRLTDIGKALAEEGEIARGDRCIICEDMQ